MSAFHDSPARSIPTCNACGQTVPIRSTAAWIARRREQVKRPMIPVRVPYLVSAGISAVEVMCNQIRETWPEHALGHDRDAVRHALERHNAGEFHGPYGEGVDRRHEADAIVRAILDHPVIYDHH